MLSIELLIGKLKGKGDITESNKNDLIYYLQKLKQLAKENKQLKRDVSDYTHIVSDFNSWMEV